MSYRGDAHLWREARSAFLGAKLGEGCARKVYLLRQNPAYVAKIEGGAGSFQNVAEWDAWSWLQGSKIAPWFAPCEWISANGVILVQQRAEPVRRGELPKRLPSILVDLKLENFGMIEGRLVCIDYGTIGSKLRDSPMALAPAKWRD